MTDDVDIYARGHELLPEQRSARMTEGIGIVPGRASVACDDGGGVTLLLPSSGQAVVRVDVHYLQYYKGSSPGLV